MASLNTIRTHLDEGRFSDLFLNELGWDRPDGGGLTIETDEGNFAAQPVASKRGFTVYRCDAVPTAASQVQVDREIAKHSAERLIVFTDGQTHQWKWPEQRKSGTGTKLVTHHYRVGSPSEAILQRLAQLEFTVDEELAGLTVLDVRDRVRAVFNAERVTERFYDTYTERHVSLRDSIENIPGTTERSWYASLLMNRLMVLYFMQKKGFLDNDRQYLRNRLHSVREVRGPDQFYDFYRYFLLPLFHRGLGARNPRYEDPAVADLIGQVPYINGGIFAEHRLEAEYEIQVPDTAFEEIFDFFDSFQWYLDDRPTGAGNEINPDVLGYIFEKYVNEIYTEGKGEEKGAYYSKQDITGYMTSNTLMPRLLELLGGETDIEPFVLLAKDPHRYLHDGTLHGLDQSLPPNIVPEQDADAAFGLPGETWREVITRRQRVDDLTTQLSDQQLTSIDELVAANIDLTALVLDAIDGLDDPSQVRRAYNVLREVRVLDPTCGSGAFLFAALDLLHELYDVLLNKAELLLAADATGARDAFGDVFAEVENHANREYFILKGAVLANLYGLDIMEEAVEIARLRMFLKLMAQLTSWEDIEPLPNLDYNIRVGNLIVGFTSLEETRQQLGASLLSHQQVERIDEHARAVDDLYQRFAEAQQEVSGAAAAEALEAALNEANLELRDEIDPIYAESRAVPEASLAGWRQTHRPFHWFVEFPTVMRAGGFDCLVGNPPYIPPKEVDYEYQGFQTDECPDIYAPCLERAAQLTVPGGRLAMITPLSLASSSDFEPARTMLSEKFPRRWVSTYAKRPASLFHGVQVRCTIFLGLAGGDEQHFATNHSVWPADYRPYLFQNIAYTQLDDAVYSSDHRRLNWPKIGSPGLNRLFVALMDAEPLEAIEQRRGTFSMWCKATGSYYLSTSHMPPKTFERDTCVEVKSNLKEIKFTAEDERDLAVVLTAGKLGYLWWSAWGDDLNVPKWVLQTFPADITAFDTPTRNRLLQLSQQLKNELPHHLMWNPNAGKWVGSYVTAECDHITDESDQIFLRHLGVENVWDDLLLWHASVMKSTGEPAGSERGPNPPCA